MSVNLAPYFAQKEGIPFIDRWAVMPFRGSHPVVNEQIQTEWKRIINQPITPNKRLIYIHIPFCATHCQFCGFYQNPLRKHDTSLYTQYLIQEILADAESPLYQSNPIHTIYFGGGTPSALSAEDLYSIISTLKRHYPLAPDCEITIEGRIMDFDEDKIDACLEAGANRFSIGIQTFNSAIRKKLNRTSTQEEAIEFLTKLANKDKAAVVCDLIFGLPGQTMETWKNDLDIIKDLPLDGVDLYALNLLPTPPLFKSVENNRITLSPIEEKERFYLYGLEFLYQAGWEQLSNSHWRRTTRERNLYNILIKQGADYLAFGSCAGGKIAGQSFMIQRNLEAYYQQLKQNEKPLMMLLLPSKQLEWLHPLQAGIEVGRVDLTQLLEQSELLRPLIQQWHSAGLLLNDDLCFRLSPKGRFWASNLLEALKNLIFEINTQSESAKQELDIADTSAKKYATFGHPGSIKL